MTTSNPTSSHPHTGAQGSLGTTIQDAEPDTIKEILDTAAKAKGEHSTRDGAAQFAEIQMAAPETADGTGTGTGARTGGGGGGGGPGPGTPGGAGTGRATSGARPTGHLVADIVIDNKDARGKVVSAVFGKKHGEYAFYKAADDSRVLVHFADDPVMDQQQRCLLAPLSGLRSKLAHFMTRTSTRDYYDSEAAEALQLALAGAPDAAKEVLTQAVAAAENERACAGRQQYLTFAAAATFVLVLVLALGRAQAPFSAVADDLWLGAMGGTVGAFFSICLAIRSRSVATDLYRIANITDGVLRVMIGMIAAGVLVLMLRTGIVPELAVGKAAITGSAASWHVVLIAGFIGGFLERLLPNLLNGDGKAPAPASSAPAGANKTTKSSSDTN